MPTFLGRSALRVPVKWFKCSAFTKKTLNTSFGNEDERIFHNENCWLGCMWRNQHITSDTQADSSRLPTDTDNKHFQCAVLHSHWTLHWEAGEHWLHAWLYVHVLNREHPSAPVILVFVCMFDYNASTYGSDISEAKLMDGWIVG